MPTADATGSIATRTRRTWGLAAGGVCTVAAVAGVLVWLNAGPDSAETTAWQDREHFNDVLAETARAAGINAVIEPGPEGPMPCTRNDGRDGVFYMLTEYVTDEPADVERITQAISDEWASRGYPVDADTPGAVKAQTPDGVVLNVAASRLGVRLGGVTGCALEDGAPAAR